jgi:hypothetical protein
MKKLIIFMLAVFSVIAYAMESTKPDDHTNAWETLHGKRAAADSSECYSCHTERLECIICHEDTKPRSHTMTWVNKSHGLEARWDRGNCGVCHTEDSCISCHDSTMPANHRPNFRNVHCQVSCQQPVGRWKNTVAKDCVTCHRRKPLPTHVSPL